MTTANESFRPAKVFFLLFSVRRKEKMGSKGEKGRKKGKGRGRGFFISPKYLLQQGKRESGAWGGRKSSSSGGGKKGKKKKRVLFFHRTYKGKGEGEERRKGEKGGTIFSSLLQKKKKNPDVKGGKERERGGEKRGFSTYPSPISRYRKR